MKKLNENSANKDIDTIVTLENTLMVKTSTRNIPIDYDGLTIYTSQPLTYGNEKLSKSIAIFDLPAIESCANCETCKHTCYALKSQIQYKHTYTKRSVNFYLAEKQPEVLKQLIIKQLERCGKSIVRIHSSGEFFSQAYIDLWAEIIALFPAISFYSYSKMTDILDFTELESLENFNLVKSVLPDGNKNFGSKAFIVQKAKQYKAKICPYNLTKTKPICGKTCSACIHNEYVLFLQH